MAVGFRDHKASANGRRESTSVMLEELVELLVDHFQQKEPSFVESKTFLKNQKTEFQKG